MKKLILVFGLAFGLSGLVFAKGMWEKNKIQSNFDFYVLSLSWSPSFCLSHNDKGGEQCDGANNYGFIVHGLWPQYENGYPRACPSFKSAPDEKLIDKMLDIMPSKRLVALQWDRHGTCSGLDANTYFSTIRRAFEKVNLPHLDKSENVGSLEKEFVQMNKGLSQQGIAIIKSKKYLSEVRICMTKELEFRDCYEVDNKAASPFENLKVPKPH